MKQRSITEYDVKKISEKLCSEGEFIFDLIVIMTIGRVLGYFGEDSLSSSSLFTHSVVEYIPAAPAEGELTDVERDENLFILRSHEKDCHNNEE